ncbi:hypothetical protein [Corynebacterium epidermidicanis]|uniref:Mycothiol system anti-sigma-R factor n=1 Tax=Corynebacterium epidermidicanis TaxID=1050174 RepID=A0A0G3GN20_9CORY|nr:hypothetical protein [Corynebacterium epidermidicanis]AKK02549.1 hypothetical protein CEPID_03345 [Corynebacterium epidermidicanis]
MSNNNCECNCTDAYDMLRRILDDDTCCERTRAQLRRQIQSCPECFAALGVEEEVRALLKRCCETTAPTTLYERISISIQVQRGR